MMNYKWKSKSLRDVAKYTKQQVEKTEKIAREYGEKVSNTTRRMRSLKLSPYIRDI